MKFIHYGCWNNIDCEKRNNLNYRNIILDYIERYENDYKFLILSGDNWYGNKNNLDKNKYYYTNILYSGFIKLYHLNKKCHLVLGNHDEDISKIDRIDELPTKSMKDFSNDIRKNCMLNTEKYYLNNLNINNINNLPLPDLKDLNNINNNFNNANINRKNKFKLILHESLENPEYNIDGNNIFIYINTNIFANNKLNKEYFINYINKIRTLLEGNINKIPFIIGHVPFISIKKKLNNIIYPILDNINLDIMDYFINTIKQYNPIYLCADTHNFELSVLDDKIAQIVVGTGGADPDLVSDFLNYDKLFQDKIHNHDLKLFANDSYGYSIIEIKNGKIYVQYKKLISSNNKIINKVYNYEITRNNNISIKFLNMSDLNKKVNNDDIQKSNVSKSNICNNLNDNNVIKTIISDKSIYCYIKKEK